MHPITRAALRSPAPLANWRTLGPYLLGFAGVGAYRCAYCGKLDHASVAVFSYATHNDPEDSEYRCPQCGSCECWPETRERLAEFKATKRFMCTLSRR